MPHKYAIVTLAVLLVLSSGCSRRRTRQFIIVEPPTQGFHAGEWEIEPPSVVAFKDIVKLKRITDTTMFWVSMRAKRLRSAELGAGSDLRIDSVSITFAGDTSQYWRTPTRVAPYDAPGDDYERKLFDFFGDQGIVIPTGIDTIVVAFDAVAVPEGGESAEAFPIRVQMVRDEKSLRMLLLQQ